MATAKPSALVPRDRRVIYCGDNLEQLQKLPPACVDLIYIDPPFNSNRNYEGGTASHDLRANGKLWRLALSIKRTYRR